MKMPNAILLGCAFLAGAQLLTAQAARIGTFDRQAVALAYYRSPQWGEVLRQKRAELRAAQQAGDQKKVDELSDWFGQAQELAHSQVFGKAPVDNILKEIAPAIENIRKAENLSAVVAAPAPDSASQAVDVTPQLLDWLKADEKTRDLIRQMQKN